MTNLVGLPGRNWVGSPDTGLAAMIVVAIWKEAGFFMIFYLAALQQISPTLAEAATLEGASRWQYFWRVLFPLLMPTTLFVLINALINAPDRGELPHDEPARPSRHAAGDRPAVLRIGLRHLPVASDVQDGADGAGDAARVEGASALQVLLKVYVPLVRPVYLAYALVSVSHHWNNFLWPLIITNSVESRRPR